jgi:hypothetical protein
MHNVGLSPTSQSIYIYPKTGAVKLFSDLYSRYKNKNILCFCTCHCFHIEFSPSTKLSMYLSLVPLLHKETRSEGTFKITKLGILCTAIK